MGAFHINLEEETSMYKPAVIIASLVIAILSYVWATGSDTYGTLQKEKCDAGDVHSCFELVSIYWEGKFNGWVDIPMPLS